MKVLFFNYEYPPLGGGAANATSYLLKEYLKISDLSVDLVTSSVDSEYHLEKLGANINIHRLPIGKNKNNLHYQSQIEILKYAFRAYFFSLKLAKKERYDLSHAFFTVPCGFLALLLKWQKNISYIVSLRGSDVPGFSERFKFVHFFLGPLIRLIWKNAGAVISASQGLKDLALKTNPNQDIGVIPNGIDINQFGHISYEVGLRKSFRILCVTRITRRKGIKYLIEAVGILHQKYSDIKLQIIGDGDEKENLINLTKSRGLENFIEFTGIVPHEKLPAYFQENQLFVLPSLNEGMSNSMLEALASGLPLVATDTGGTKELLDDGVNGYVVKMKDSQDLADKIEKIMADKNLEEKMAEASRKKAEGMSWEKVAKQYFDLYSKLKN